MKKYLATRLAFLENKYRKVKIDKDQWMESDTWARILEVKEALRFLETGKCLYTGDIQQNEFNDLV